MAVPSTNGANGANGVNGASSSSSSAKQPERTPRKLILCFDGTGNKFSGSNADTNVVKILNKFDRHHPEQYHYYQTGIGTYGVNETSVNKTWLGGIKSSISQTVDEGLATTFDAHVMAGYRFLMRYHEPKDVIYMFGFSRGAFTAKFLARMIHTVGLLCKGNEEMVPFAYLLYQKYLSVEVEEYVASGSGTAPTPSGKDGETVPLLHNDDDDDDIKRHGKEYRKVMNEIRAFGNTFCRKEKFPVKTPPGQEQWYREENIKVYFLGLWDCVSSVAVLESQAPLPVPVLGTASYVRHAVAVDERRVKFKPALLAQDVEACQDSHGKDDIKEVWFPGGHCDIGGGYGAREDNPADYEDELVPGKASFWTRVRNFWWSRRPHDATEDYRNDAFQLSDVPLAWMLKEVDAVGKLDESKKINWGPNYEGFKAAFATEHRKLQALNGVIHDSLRFGSGSAFFKVLLWKFMEHLPFIKRWELNKDKKWEQKRFPLNKGASRDIPDDAVLHQSVLWRLQNVGSYKPQNNHGDGTSSCLAPVGGGPAVSGGVAIASYNLKSRDSKEDGEGEGQDHETFTFVKK